MKFLENLECIDKLAVKEIGDIEHLTVAEGTVVIGAEAFFKMTSLKSVTLPNTLKRIEKCAFFGTSLRRIFIPKSVEYIGRLALPDCEIYLEGESDEDWYCEEERYYSADDYCYDFHRGGVSWTCTSVYWHSDSAKIFKNVSKEDFEKIEKG